MFIVAKEVLGEVSTSPLGSARMHEEVEKLVSAGKLTRPLGEKLSALEPGRYCYHKSWGAGQIMSWDLVGDKLTVHFEGKPDHSLKLEFAAKSLEPLADEHLLAKRYSDRESLRALSESNPVDLVALALRGQGGTMLLDQLDAMLKGTVIDDARYKSWWESTKKKLREHPLFVVPAKRNLPLEMREEGTDLTHALAQSFKSARELKAKILALESILKEAEQFRGAKDRLRAVLEEVNEVVSKNQRIQPSAAIEMVHLRDRLQEIHDDLAEGLNKPAISELLAGLEGRMESVLGQLTAGTQRRAYEAFPEAFGEKWVDSMLSLLNSTGIRGVAEITRFVTERGKTDDLVAFLQIGVQQRSLSSEVLSWICKERNRASTRVFDAEVASAIITAMERDHFEEETRRTSKLQDVMLADSMLIRDMLSKASKHQVRLFTRRLRTTPAVEELSRNSLLARIYKEHAYVQELITGPSDEEAESTESLVVSWESLNRRKEQLDELVQKLIPENSKEIALARSYGDLRENFEFKAAKEMQAVLLKRKDDMEREVQLARGTDFVGADTTHVSIGTIVTVKDTASGQQEVFKILGAWDTKLEENIISYLSSTAQALLGKKVGETASLPTEENEVSRTVSVESIEPFAKAE